MSEDKRFGSLIDGAGAERRSQIASNPTYDRFSRSQGTPAAGGAGESLVAGDTGRRHGSGIRSIKEPDFSSSRAAGDRSLAAPHADPKF